MSRFDDYISSFPSRTMCAVLEEMRSATKTMNFSYMMGLIEELQTLGNRMEAHLDTQRTYSEFRDSIREARKELTKLKKEIKLYTEIKESK